MSEKPKKIVSIGKNVRCGYGEKLTLIAGPCALQKEYNSQIAEKLVALGEKYPVSIIFKGSFDKGNRTSIDAPRGPGIDAGLDMLREIAQQFSLPVTTDIHETQQTHAVSEVCDLLQIPAFLARQTDLLVAAATTGKPVHVKKGQFMSPADMKNVVRKLEASGCAGILLGERGTFFGYGRLVNDFTSLVEMRDLGMPVVFDATHSVQQPGGLGTSTGGNRKMVPPLARAAIAVGIDALFLETHPEPEKSPSDGANMIPLDELELLLVSLLRIREAVK